MTDQEANESAPKDAHSATPDESADTRKQIVDEIRRIETSSTHWTDSLLLLVVSFGLFLGARASMSTDSPSGAFTDLPILIAVLLFHESGHWIAMKAFGYRNVKMFFIPFFGAAVSGRRYDVPGWKKAVVSLMGPLPGIMLGALLVAIGLLRDNQTVLSAAQTALLINGLNLLPFLPFDGGWVVQSAISPRRVGLLVGFRVFAVLGLATLAIYFREWVLGLIAYFMVASLPSTFKVAKISAALRASGFDHISDGDVLPQAAAEPIVDKVVEAFPDASVQRSAQLSIEVYESLNAVPPRPAVAVGLGLVQAAGVVAVIFFVGLSVMKMPRVGASPKAEAQLPLEEFGETEAPLPATPFPHHAIVANFPTHAGAIDAERELKQVAPQLVGTTVFGRALIAAYRLEDQAERAKVLDLAGSRQADAFAAMPETPARLSLSCRTESAERAAELDDEIRGYFAVHDPRAIPPWSPADSRTPEQRAADQRARWTLYQLSSGVGLSEDAILSDLTKKRQAVWRRGEMSESERLKREYDARWVAVKLSDMERVERTEHADARVLQSYRALFEQTKKDPDPKVLAAQIRPYLGIAPDDSSRPFSAQGLHTTEGNALRLLNFRFKSSYLGPVAMARWLQKSGCGDMTYTLTEPFYYDGAGEDEEEFEEL